MACVALSRSIVAPAVALALAGCLAQNPDFLDPPPATTSDTASDAGTSGDAPTTTGASATTSATTSTTTTGEETTDDTEGDTDEETTDGTTGRAPYCGDGVVDDDEECDDGDDIDDDECTALCTLPVCGDGILQIDEGEVCDNGPQNGVGDSCTEVCQDNVCGDGIQGLGEACDDGNVNDNDGCNKECKLEKCGNGVIDGDEVCDDGNDIDTDGCTVLCLPPPTLGDLDPVGYTANFGPPGGDFAGEDCNGGLVGFAGDYDTMQNVVASFRSLCTGVDLEAIGGGLFRLRQLGPIIESEQSIGGIALEFTSFYTVCAAPERFLTSIGGYTSAAGIHEFAPFCAEIHVKPIGGKYQIFPQYQDEDMEQKIGMPIGMQTMKIRCEDYPGTLAGGYAADIPSLIGALRLHCVKPQLMP